MPEKKTVKIIPIPTLPSIKEEVVTPTILKENYFARPVQTISREKPFYNKGGKSRKRKTNKRKTHKRR